MPTYEYACTSCGEHLEVAQSFRDDPLTECPACGGVLRKVFGSIGVVFKGSGFYKTDSRPAAKSASSKADSAASAGSGGDSPARASNTGDGSSAATSKNASSGEGAKKSATSGESAKKSGSGKGASGSSAVAS